MLIGTGNRIEMLNFIREVKKDIEKLNLNLKVRLENVKIKKYGKVVNSKFYEVYVDGNKEDIQTLIDNNQ